MSNEGFLLLLSGGVNRFVELVKAQLERTTIAPDIRRIILLITALIAGVVAVAASQPFVTVFTGTMFESWNPALATIVTGLTVGLGADAIHLVLDLVRALSGKQAAQAAKTLSDTPSGLNAQAEIGGTKYSVRTDNPHG